MVSSTPNVTEGEECTTPSLRGEVDSRQTLGERMYNLAPEVAAENCKVGSALLKYHGRAGPTKLKVNIGGELVPEVEAGK